MGSKRPKEPGVQHEAASAGNTMPFNAFTWISREQNQIDNVSDGGVQALALPIIAPSVAAGVEIHVASEEHFVFTEQICNLIERAAAARGTGIAKRAPEYIRGKMSEGKAVIALGPRGEVAGFCYIETWDHGKYAANSGLIVSPAFRKMGLARRIKRQAFELSRRNYPDAKLFGITTSLAVMKINSELGYKPVTFSELTSDDVFWQGCQSCPNYDVLTRMKRSMCLCTGMLYDPAAP